MSDSVQITLIICITFIIYEIISGLHIECKSDKPRIAENEKDNSRLEIYCKSPTYERPPRPNGTKDTSRLDEIFSRQPNNSSAEKIKNIKPPQTGSGIK